MSNNSLEHIYKRDELLRVGSYTTDRILIKWELDECDKSFLIVADWSGLKTRYKNIFPDSDSGRLTTHYPVPMPRAIQGIRAT